MPTKDTFWSRRRAAVARDDEAAERAQSRAVEAEEAREAEAVPEADLLRDLGLPDPDTLGASDDFTGFMARHVPAQLRRRAIRALIRARPDISPLDGLLDYDDDYTDAAVAQPGIASRFTPEVRLSERPPEMPKDVEARRADPSEDAAAVAGADPEEAPVPDPPDESPGVPPGRVAPALGDEPEGDPDALPVSAAPDPARVDAGAVPPRHDSDSSEAEDTPPAAPRRMAFRFEVAS